MASGKRPIGVSKVPLTGTSMPNRRDAALEFMNVPLDEARPVVWAVNEYEYPTGRHYDVHVGVEMGVVLTGKSRRLYPDHGYSTRPGEVWFAGLWEPHGMQILEPSTKHFVLGFLPEFLGVPDTQAHCDWMQLFRLPPEQRPRAASQAQRGAALRFADRMIAILNSNDVYRLAKLRIAMQEFLLFFMSVPKSAGIVDFGDPLSAHQHNLLSAFQLVDRRPDLKITLADGAQAAGMSRSQFAKQFHLQTGTTFAQYLIRRRIGGVMGDLRSTDQKLQAIAARWGFADASHLVRLFKSHTGATPDSYRKQNSVKPSHASELHAGTMPKPHVFE